MAHKFDVKDKHKLDNEKRRAIMPPYETLLRLGLKKDDMMADIGCGIGYFSIPASDIAGERAKVYAMDISVEMLEEVERKTREMNISNIRTILIDEYDFKTESNLFDFALVSNVLHEVEDKPCFITEAKRILKSGGRLAIIEWQKMQSDYGPPVDHRIDKDTVANLLRESGFIIENSIEIGVDLYGIVGVKL